jgi:hypothetical protein
MLCVLLIGLDNFKHKSNEFFRSQTVLFDERLPEGFIDNYQQIPTLMTGLKRLLF